jgi:TRAP-type C4-dicarboxylate transport system permease small subunit
VSDATPLERTLRALERATAAVASAVLAAMVMLLAFGPVQAWLGLGRPVQWLTEIAEYGLLQLALLGGALALRRGAHPALDLVVRRLPVRTQGRVSAAADLATGVLGALLLVLGSGYVLASHAVGGPLDTIALPKWPFYLCYPVGGALIVAFSAGRLAVRLHDSGTRA